MRRPVIVSLAAGALGLVVALVPSVALAASSTGYDVSYPQCASWRSAETGTLPAGAGFAIVGVNNGLPNATNSCLAAELAWASAAGSAPQLYVNTANPGKAASWWPTSNVTQHGAVKVANPYGTCSKGHYDEACSYVYGYSMARDDAIAREISHPASYRWWLDVETSNTWSKTDKGANRADVEGMAAAFAAQHASVGLYSTTAQWNAIVGTVPATSRIASLPTWVALGKSGLSAASSACAGVSFTRGRLTLTQYVAAGVDRDVSCQRLTAGTAPSITGTLDVGHKLTAHAGSVTPAATPSYQWRRAGAVISKATHSTYRLTKADAGKAITVSVTEKRSGYSKLTRTSAARTVHHLFSKSPSPKIKGTAASGKKLSITKGTWKPKPSFHYQWYRGSKAISKATHSTYRLTSKDKGAKVRVTVTATKKGYTTVRPTSAAVRVKR